MPGSAMGRLAARARRLATDTMDDVTTDTAPPTRPPDTWLPTTAPIRRTLASAAAGLKGSRGTLARAGRKLTRDSDPLDRLAALAADVATRSDLQKIDYMDAVAALAQTRLDEGGLSAQKRQLVQEIFTEAKAAAGRLKERDDQHAQYLAAVNAGMSGAAGGFQHIRETDKIGTAASVAFAASKDKSLADARRAPAWFDEKSPENAKLKNKPIAMMKARVAHHNERMPAMIAAYSLTEAEATAIRIYTTESYSYINPAAANKTSWMQAANKAPAGADANAYHRELTLEGKGHQAMIASGIAKLPPVARTFFRGDKLKNAGEMAVRGFTVGNTITTESLVSVSLKQVKAKDFAVTASFPVILHYAATDARDIRSFSIHAEDEYIIPMNRKFRVQKITTEKYAKDHPNAGQVQYTHVFLTQQK